jgi:hypothetical protein
MKEVKKSNKTIIRISLLGAGVLVVLLMIIFSLEKVNIPEEFTLAREGAAKASEEISNILNGSLENLSLIARYEREGKIDDARDLAQVEIDKSDARNQAALALATAVQGMAISAEEINSEPAKQKIVEASSFQVTAITHILSYNSLLEKLLIDIDTRFQIGLETSEKRVRELLAELNEEAREINKLNEKFTASIKEFDSIVATKVQ